MSESYRILNHLCSVHIGFTVTTTRSVAKDLLLNHSRPMARGRLYELKARSVGAGVWSVWLEELMP